MSNAKQISAVVFALKTSLAMMAIRKEHGPHSLQGHHWTLTSAWKHASLDVKALTLMMIEEDSIRSIGLIAAANTPLTI